jgi:predicted DNA-binding protein (UPF0251 family)
MARPEKNRTISQPPLMKGFKPFGIPRCKVEALNLTFEEYESIRLVNYENMPQKEAAALMNVSRPTLTRIYNKALKTISKAFVEGKAIVIEGGNYELAQDWYRCRKCHKLIEADKNQADCEETEDCHPNELINLNK